MTDLYFFKIFFIDKIIPYTLMTLSIAYLLLELIAPKELRFVFYDFSDRLFFKFIYRPTNKFLNLLKNFFIFNLRKFRELLAANQKKKIIRARKKAEKKALKTERKHQASIIKHQKKEIKAQEKFAKKEEQRHIKSIKKEEKLQIKLVKKEEKLKHKLENKRLKNEVIYKLKLFLAHKIKKLINKKKTRQYKQ